MVLISVSFTFLLYDWGFKNILQWPTIALLLHRISHVAQCVWILTKALLVFILLLKMAYVELKVGKRKHALVSHILQNQTKDPWRWQIKQADQDCAHMWKVDDGNGILLLWISLLYLDNMRSWLYYCISLFFISFFFLDLDVSNFFGSCFLGMPSFFLIANTSFEGY